MNGRVKMKSIAAAFVIRNKRYLAYPRKIFWHDMPENYNENDKLLKYII